MERGEADSIEKPVAWRCVKVLLTSEEGERVLRARCFGREFNDDLALVCSHRGRLGAWGRGGVWQSYELALPTTFSGVSALNRRKR